MRKCLCFGAALTAVLLGTYASAATDDSFANEPSSEAQLLAGSEKPLPKGPFTEGMSEEQTAWEALLRSQLGSFYYPRYITAKKEGTETAWDYVKDDPALPRILIIGDSISRGYTMPVRHLLKGKVNVHRAPTNCGSSGAGYNKLDSWLGDRNWDVITFNFGIHDRGAPDQGYANRIKNILGRLQETGAKVVWVNTTPVPPGAREYRKGASERLNRVAEVIMKEKGIEILDLYAKVTPVLEKYQIPDNCHFELEGYEFMGQIVADTIIEKLQEKVATE